MFHGGVGALGGAMPSSNLNDINVNLTLANQVSALSLGGVGSGGGGSLGEVGVGSLGAPLTLPPPDSSPVSTGLPSLTAANGTSNNIISIISSQTNSKAATAQLSIIERMAAVNVDVLTASLPTVGTPSIPSSKNLAIHHLNIHPLIVTFSIYPANVHPLVVHPLNAPSQYTLSPLPS